MLTRRTVSSQRAGRTALLPAAQLLLVSHILSLVLRGVGCGSAPWHPALCRRLVVCTRLARRGRLTARGRVAAVAIAHVQVAASRQGGLCLLL